MEGVVSGAGLPRDAMVNTMKPSMDIVTQTPESGASMPTISQMRSAEDALGVDPEVYTPLVRL